MKAIINNEVEIEVKETITGFCNSDIVSVIIPDGVVTIGDNAFDGCESLKEITIPDSVVRIGSYAFYGCDSLKEIAIPDSVTEIGEYAFECDFLE